MVPFQEWPLTLLRNRPSILRDTSSPSAKRLTNRSCWNFLATLPRGRDLRPTHRRGRGQCTTMLGEICRSTAHRSNKLLGTLGSKRSHAGVFSCAFRLVLDTRRCLPAPIHQTLRDIVAKKSRFHFEHPYGPRESTQGLMPPGTVRDTEQR